jgi:hypothetical protein
VQQFNHKLALIKSVHLFAYKKHTGLFANQIYNRKFANSFRERESLTACRVQATNINKCGHNKLQNDFSKQGYC